LIDFEGASQTGMLRTLTTESNQQSAAIRIATATQRQRKMQPSGGGAYGLRPARIYGFGAPVGAALVRQNFPRLQKTGGNQAMLRSLCSSPPRIQTKLAINQPGDQYEQEADRVADQVMGMPEPCGGGLASFLLHPAVQRDCSCGGEGGECTACREEEKLQRSPATSATQQTAPPSVHATLCSPGQPLDAATRRFMEPRFGHDFSQTRLHYDDQAAQSARAVNALAYTVGSHIVFGAAQHNPGTNASRHLLAHELTHVIQQTGADGPASKLSVQRFTTAEHLEIGNAAYAMAANQFSGPAFKQSPLYLTLRNGSQLPTGSRVKAYGDIVADGDFFQTFEELIQKSGERPGRVGMAVLATRNVQHFTPNNIRDWIPQHDFALEQMVFAHEQLAYVKDWLSKIDPLLQGARAALLRDDDATAQRLLNEYQRQFNPQSKRMSSIIQNAHGLAKQALARNAFAEHFLTDAFSAGHVVTPRQEILQEAGVRLDQMPTSASLVRSALLGTTWGELGEVRAQARSLAWHDLDNFYGVEVQNNKPGSAPWIACGDGCSGRTLDQHWAATKSSVVEATAHSIEGLWRAGLTGVRPSDYRGVLDLVPRPTFNNYPRWTAADWQLQLQYIRGDKASPVSGEQLTPFAVELHPIEHCAQPDIGCYEPFVLTAKDWIRQYNFDRWVQSWIGRVRASASTRYRF
jgi:Domain of unknown function (DUF4157)